MVSLDLLAILPLSGCVGYINCTTNPLSSVDEYTKQIVLKIGIFLFFHSGRRNNFSSVGLALGWRVRNMYFLDSGRRTSPYLRGEILLRFHL